MEKERGLPSQYEQVVKSIGEKGHVFDLHVEFLPAVGGRIQSTIPYDKTSLHREYSFDGLGELNQVDIFRQVRKEESDTNEEGANETAFHLTLRRGNDGKFFIDSQAIRPHLLKKWHIEHPKIVPVPLSEQISRRKFIILLKTALIEIRMTQKEFARKNGTNEVTVSRWIRGETVPNLQNLEFMIDFFHWDKDHVLNAGFHKPEGFMLRRRQVRRKSHEIKALIREQFSQREEAIRSSMLKPFVDGGVLTERETLLIYLRFIEKQRPIDIALSLGLATHSIYQSTNKLLKKLPPELAGELQGGAPIVK